MIMEPTLIFGWFLISVLAMAGTLDSAGDVAGPKLISYPSPVNPFSNSVGLTLSCQGTAPNTPLVYQWLSGENGEMLTRIPGIREQLDNGSLHFYPFSPAEFIDSVHNARYRCFVQNPVATYLSPVFIVRAVIDEQFQVQILPAATTTTTSLSTGTTGLGKNSDWLEHNPAVLKCHVNNRKLYPNFIKTLAWKEIDEFGHEREILETDTTRYVITYPQANLLILQAPLQRLFVCVAKNTLNSQVKSSAPYLFKAKKLQNDKILAPQPFRDISATKYLLSENLPGNNKQSVLDLLCIVTGNPVPVWRWEVKDTSSSNKWLPYSNSEFSNPGPVLRLKYNSGIVVSATSSVIASVNGTYRCEASNNFGTSTVEFSVETQVAPKVSIKPERVLAYPGQNVEYVCNLKPGNSDFVWYKNGKPVLASSRVSVSGHLLKLVNVRLEDQGIYQCFAENSSVASAELIFPPSAPELVQTFISQSVQPGPSISLKCSALGNPAPVIFWFIDDLMVPLAGTGFETVMMAAAPSTRKYLWMGQQQQQRFQHGIVQNPGTGEVISYLNVSGVHVEDSGLYKCVAENLVRAVSHSARLNVYGGIFVREMEEKVTYAHGDTIYIPCHYGGYPVDKVIWQKDSRNLISSGVETQQAGRYVLYTNGTLRIEQVKAESGSGGGGQEDKGRYTCVVSNRKGEVASGSVNIDVMNPPQISPMHMEDTLAEGKRTSLVCNVISGDLPISISWLKDGFPLPPLLNVTENRVRFLSVLAFDSLHESHSGVYTCLAQNSARLVKQSATLLVRVSPKWTLAPQNTKAILGSDHSIECRAKGVPTPRISWFRVMNGVNIQLVTNHKFSLHSNSTLLKVRQISESDQGSYSCHADNGVGSPIQKSVDLNVIIPARIVKPEHAENSLDTPAAVLIVAEGADTSLKCLVRGDGPVQVTWKKGSIVLGMEQQQQQKSPLLGKQIEEKLIQVNSTVYEAELKISRAQLEDAAVYECLASNQYGRDGNKIELRVKARPGAPEEFRVEEIGSRYIRLKWSYPKKSSHATAGGDPITNFLVQWHKQDNSGLATDQWLTGSQNLSVSAYQHFAVIEMLHPVTTYGVRIFAQNKYGRSLPTKQLVVLTLGEAPSGQPLNLTAVPTGPSTVFCSWKPPEIEKQHGSIQGYQVLAVSENRLFPKNQSVVSLDVKYAEEARLQGLKPNFQYRVSVSAYNGAGMGPESGYVYIQTPEGAPDGPPRNVKCESLSPKSVQVQWEAPEEHLQNGNILGYKVSYIGVEGERLGEKPEVKKTANRETTLHGLKSFTNYLVKVLAYTVGGESEQSESVECVTEEDLPGEVEDVKVICGGVSTAVVVWLAPRVTNGVVVKYTVYWREVEGEGGVKEKQVGVGAGTGQAGGDLQYSTEIRRLKENGQYKVWVSAWTSAGQGKASKTEVVRVTPGGLPRIGSFAVVKSVGLGEQVVLPCLVVGEGKVRWWKDGVMDTRQTGKNGSLVINRVRDQDEGEYKCRVENERGTEEIEHRVVISRAPGRVQAYLGYVTRETIQLHWEQMKKVNPKLLGYLVEWRRRESEEHWGVVKVGEHQSGYLIEGLRCGTEYQVRVAGVNKVGRGEYGEVVNTRTNGGKPEDKPRLTEILDGNGTMVRIDLSRWSDGGCAVKRVSVEWRREGEEDWVPVVQFREGEGQMVQKVWTLRTELKERYEIRVKLENDAGHVERRFLVESHPDFFRNYAKVLERVEKEGGEGDRGGEKGAAGGGKVVPFYTDPHVVVPIISAIICTAAIAIGCMMWMVRRRNLRKEREGIRENSEWKFSQGQMIPRELQGNHLQHQQQQMARQSWMGMDKGEMENTGEIYATLNSTKPIPMTIRDSTVRLHSFGSFDNYEGAPPQGQYQLTGQYLKKGKRKSCGGSTPLTPVEPMGMQEVVNFSGRIIEPPQEFRCSEIEDLNHFRKNGSTSRGVYGCREEGASLDDIYHDYSYPYHEFPASSSSEMLQQQLGSGKEGKEVACLRNTLRKSSGRGSKPGSKRNSRGDDDLFQ